jgi:hypothetical protein
MNVSFYDWVEDASNRGRFEMYLDDDHVTCAYLTRFNLEIVDLVSRFGEEAITKAIWHRYGACGGDIWNATEPVLGRARVEFMRSVKSLYLDGFAGHCSHHFGHIDSGPECPRPLNGPCHMLWDMDGIECRAINGDDEMLDLSLEVLAHALVLDHPACQESALHGLGHLLSTDPDRVRPLIQHGYLQTRVVEPELRAYAQTALDGWVE